MLEKYHDSMLKTDLFDAFFYGLPSTTRQRSSALNDYRVEASESGLTLSLDLPGVKSKDLSVQVTGREIKVSGRRRGEDFKYTYRLSKDYDTEYAAASLEDGVLTLNFKKTKGSDTRTIEIQVK